MLILSVLFGLSAPGPQAKDTQAELVALEAKVRSAEAMHDVAKSFPLYEEAQSGALKLIVDDALKEASDFRRAAGLFAPVHGDLLPLESQYELTLVAAADGDAEARSRLGLRWDNLLTAMGRGRRIGAMKIDIPYGGARFEVHPTASVILAVYADPDSAVAKAKECKDNEEVKALVDADQKARDFDFSTSTPGQIEGMAKGDVERLRRIKELVQAGDLATADDFDRAALVFQHGDIFEDYATAHELSVCALLLGKRSASWLAGASYDRMLVNCGIPQRFGTQYGSAGSSFRLQRYETWGINDAERTRIVRTTLEQATKRKFN